MPTFKDVLQQVKSQIKEIKVQELQEKLTKKERFLLLDVRERDEVADGIIDGAQVVPRGLLDLKIEDIAPDKTQQVVIYCAGGTRSALAARTLHELGYSDVISVEGGFGAWKRAGYSFSIPRTLNQEQLSRYARHLIIPEVGERGQKKLLDSKVLLLGAGGLGSPVALYLAAAGVGTIGLIDSDVVDRSNLQRQILHTDDRVGVPKVESARQTLTALNPDVKVVPIEARLTSDNAMELFKGWDVIVDGGDNFPTRYLVNDAAYHLNIPIVHGSVYRFEGQVTSFVPNQGPCYRCLYPEPPPAEFAPSCQEAGVLGVLPGVIGLLQATEAIKLLLGIGESLAGRLLVFDALGMKFRELRLRRDKECPLCGEHATLKGLIDYEQFCSVQF
jgi:molybdopterin/thiamine biosynthesis adenylyltransferase/rhodanese-related sulfurtransferase